MAKIAIIMGSKSDMSIMETTKEIFLKFQIEYQFLIVSAHRSPQFMVDFAKTAASKYDLIIAGAGGAAHLPGMIASLTILPVLGVPIPSKHLKGMDSLLSIVQMPTGIPVGTLAIGQAGAKNSALLAVRILALKDKSLQQSLYKYESELQNQVVSMQKAIDLSLKT